MFMKQQKHGHLLTHFFYVLDINNKQHAHPNPSFPLQPHPPTPATSWLAPFGFYPFYMVKILMSSKYQEILYAQPLYGSQIKNGKVKNYGHMRDPKWPLQA